MGFGLFAIVFLLRYYERLEARPGTGHTGAGQIHSKTASALPPLRRALFTAALLRSLAHARALRVFLVHVLFEGIRTGEDEATLTARNDLRDIDAVVVAQVLIKLTRVPHLDAADAAAKGSG